MIGASISKLATTVSSFCSEFEVDQKPCVIVLMSHLERPRRKVTQLSYPAVFKGCVYNEPNPSPVSRALSASWQSSVSEQTPRKTSCQ